MVLNNKRGWLRILESFIGVMIIAGVLLFIYSDQPKQKIDTSYISYLQSQVLDEIEINESLRNDILSGKITLINKSAEAKIPNTMGFEVKVCELQDEVGCKGTYIEKERFTKDKIIATNLTFYSPKKVRLIIWMK